jgi:hypothetical protein
MQKKKKKKKKKKKTTKQKKNLKPLKQRNKSYQPVTTATN